MINPLLSPFSFRRLVTLRAYGRPPKNLQSQIEILNPRNVWVLSSRPRALPPQPLTDPDVNLPIHPAPIDQPTVPQIASEQTYEASVLQCAEEAEAPCVCDCAAFCISGKPIAAMRG